MNRDLNKLTIDNSKFRNIIYTSNVMQLVLMSIKPGEEIKEEVHDTVDQFIRVELGECDVTVGDEVHSLKQGDFIIIPKNNKHRVQNTGQESLKLYTIYAPREHPDPMSDHPKLNELNTVHNDKTTRHSKYIDFIKFH